jgi:hypothetical protein
MLVPVRLLPDRVPVVVTISSGCTAMDGMLERSTAVAAVQKAVSLL